MLETGVVRGVKWTGGGRSVDSVTLNVNGTEFAFSVGFKSGRSRRPKRCFKTVKRRFSAETTTKTHQNGVCQIPHVYIAINLEIPYNYCRPSINGNLL
jgi:hypothetical protein